MRLIPLDQADARLFEKEPANPPPLTNPRRKCKAKDCYVLTNHWTGYCPACREEQGIRDRKRRKGRP